MKPRIPRKQKKAFKMAQKREAAKLGIKLRKKDLKITKDPFLGDAAAAFDPYSETILPDEMSV